MLGKLHEPPPHEVHSQRRQSCVQCTHIEDLEEYDLRYILGTKEGDHKFLFEFVDQAVETGEAIVVVIPDETQEAISHCFCIVYNAPLNKSNQDLKE